MQCRRSLHSLILSQKATHRPAAGLQYPRIEGDGKEVMATTIHLSSAPTPSMEKGRGGDAGLVYRLHQWYPLPSGEHVGVG
jgi:hypothetical protein